MNRIVDLLEQTGSSAIATFKMIHAMVALFYDTLVELARTGRKGFGALVKQVTSQVLFTGVEAFWLVGIIGLLCGITIIVQATTNMPKFGVGEYFGRILVVVVVRELGPFFTSLVVVARSGSALAAFIANLRVNREMDALEVMGINPVKFIVMPAFVAMVISLVCLAIYFDIIAIIGGYCIAQLNVDIQFGIFISSVLNALTVQDLVISMIKNLMFGSIVATVSCYYGLMVNNIRQVPQAALKSVVSAMIATLMINVLISVLFYL
jgi:phospholipid/cholesterol/gamma-HCH transport system permease protein